jgi:hypothetical protein
MHFLSGKFPCLKSLAKAKGRRSKPWRHATLDYLDPYEPVSDDGWHSNEVEQGEELYHTLTQRKHTTAVSFSFTDILEHCHTEPRNKKRRNKHKCRQQNVNTNLCDYEMTNSTLNQGRQPHPNTAMSGCAKYYGKGALVYESRTSDREDLNRISDRTSADSVDCVNFDGEDSLGSEVKSLGDVDSDISIISNPTISYPREDFAICEILQRDISALYANDEPRCCNRDVIVADSIPQRFVIVLETRGDNPSTEDMDACLVCVTNMSSLDTWADVTAEPSRTVW